MITFGMLEQQKAELLESLRRWPAARTAYRPAADAWSAAEVLDHIVKVETEILAAVRRGLLQPHRIGVRDRVGFWMLDRIFRSDRRVKVPASARKVLPDPNASLAAVAERWDATRRDLARLLEQVPPGEQRAGVFRHPVSGWMTLPQVLRFFWVHVEHHGFQLRRLAEG